MSKVKITRRDVVEVEVDDDTYPVYLYYQKDDCMTEELIQVNELSHIRIHNSYSGNSIEYGGKYYLNQDYERHKTTEEHFNETLSNFLDRMLSIQRDKV